MANSEQEYKAALQALFDNRSPSSFTDTEILRKLATPAAEPLMPCFWASIAHPQSHLLAAFTLFIGKVNYPNHPIQEHFRKIASRLLGNVLEATTYWEVSTQAILLLYQRARANLLRQGNKADVPLVEALLDQLEQTQFPTKRCACCGSVVHAFEPLSSYYSEQRKKYCKKAEGQGSIESGKHTQPSKPRSHKAEMLNSAQYSCPVCYAADRDRAYALWMDRELPRDRPFTVLEIAPCPATQYYIKKHFPLADYKSGDLYMEGVDYKLDIMDMHQIADGSIDFFLCSHVLEHVRDDIQAMRELRRILSPSGRGILVVPMDLSQTFIDEDPDCTDVGERWRRFGQDDHVRKYSRQGWLERLNSIFDVSLYGKEFFGPKAMEENALLETSTLYVVSVPK